MPTVSICIPCYNNKESLKRLLDSIMIQDYRDFEVIATDDSDSSEIEDLVKKYDFVLYLHNSNRLGATANCNKAISMASGKYIKIMHHDDWFAERGSLGKMVAMLDDNPNAILAFCGTVQYSNNKNYSRHISTEDALMYQRNYKTIFLRNQIGAPSAVIFRNRDVLFDPKLIWLVDMDLYLQLLDTGETFVYSKEPYICIGMGDNALTNQCVDNISMQKQEYCYLFKKYNLRTEKECKYFFVKKMINLGTNYNELRSSRVSLGLYLYFLLKYKIREWVRK